MFVSKSYSIENFYDEAKKLFEKEKYEQSKFMFQRDIVFNPKQSRSYLYLAKIFKLEDNLKEEEKWERNPGVRVFLAETRLTVHRQFAVCD